MRENGRFPHPTYAKMQRFSRANQAARRPRRAKAELVKGLCLPKTVPQKGVLRSTMPAPAGFLHFDYGDVVLFYFFIAGDES